MISSAQEGIDQEKEKNFEDAQGFCEREGGNLITVSGEDINQFLVVNGLTYVIFCSVYLHDECKIDSDTSHTFLSIFII